MRRTVTLGLVLAAGLAIGFAFRSAATAEDKKGGKMVGHMVYFSLKDNSPAAKEKMIAASKKYLAKHPGTEFFAVGTVVEELNREVNDRDWDIALQLVFTDKAAHDKYQDAPLHKQFIEENRENWKKVRVFDAYVEK